MRFRLPLIILGLLLFLASAELINAQDPTPAKPPLVSFNVAYGGRIYDSAANQTTFTYTVSGTGQPPDLSHFDVGLPVCSPQLIVVGTSPTDAVSFGVDPTTGVDGIKWDLPLKTTESRTYTITLAGNVAEGTVSVAVKGGDGANVGTISGPSCTVASIDVAKFVSTDGANWQEADEPPGLEVASGVQVSFRFVVTNTGNIELNTLILTDSVYDTSICTVPETLAPGAAYECIVGPFPAAEGEHTNTVTASGVFEDQTVMAADQAYYFSGNLPLIELAKFVSADGGTTWNDSVDVAPGDNVAFKLVVTNRGNVALTNLTLTDSVFDTASCPLPSVLEPDLSFECILGPFPAGDTPHTNTATVTAAFEDFAVTAADTASYQPSLDQDDSAINMVIEGPVDLINGNVITIFDMDIEVAPNDPSLTWLQVGDTIRVEGNMLGTGNTIVIVAVNIIVVDVDIVIVEAFEQPGGPIFVPPGCKLTGIGNNNPHLKCSDKGSKKS